MEEKKTQTIAEIEAEIIAAYRLLDNLGPKEIVKRMNPKTGKMEHWNQPEGLPGIWSEPGFCERCKPYGQCIGLTDIPEDEWKTLIDELGENINLDSLIELCNNKGYSTNSCN